MESNEEYIYNVKGRVRLVKEQGYGFIVPLEKINEEDVKSDIYFHVSQITNEGLLWESVKTGQNVHINCLTRSVKGYSAVSVTFIRPK